MVSFERARRVESNNTKIKDRSKLWAEIQVPENQKTIGGSKLIFGVKNSNIQMIAYSKELVELSRMIPKLTRFDYFRQSYDQKLIMVRTHFWVICIFEFFTPKNDLTPPYGFSNFMDLYLGPELRPNKNFGTIRLNSMSSFE